MSETRNEREKKREKRKTESVAWVLGSKLVGLFVGKPFFSTSEVFPLLNMIRGLHSIRSGLRFK